jgi:hypothetical protein
LLDENRICLVADMMTWKEPATHYDAFVAMTQDGYIFYLTRGGSKLVVIHSGKHTEHKLNKTVPEVHTVDINLLKCDIEQLKTSINKPHSYNAAMTHDRYIFKLQDFKSSIFLDSHTPRLKN